MLIISIILYLTSLVCAFFFFDDVHPILLLLIPVFGNHTSDFFFYDFVGFFKIKLTYNIMFIPSVPRVI